ncbi:unnamed protein product [Rotaria sordida]|uniref:Alpha/beta hydrolase fold-3 domain-containing protein n=1 Tax=Rotaria sordida TaxID=392033 RepID=A0A818N527_9BILA|nr:unnamed protein product [Rotaria sordida]CAF1091190.1 unnamed protein product [Rotaria sordida]CAF3599915.1 unnamed protein product [Rotaria sordida]CAF4020666.1 unnamed protein product [Rotaria sordida]
MSFLNTLLGFLKKLALFILIVAIVIPFRYSSTDPKYICVRLIHSILSIKHSLIPDRARPTLSANYRAFEEMLRMMPFLKFDTSADALTVIKEMRASFTMNSIIPKPSQCQINKEVFEYDGHAVDAYWVSYPPKTIQKDSDKILLYIHSGGYLLGNIHSFSGLECRLSELFNLTILHVEYRLCPEHPLPAAVDDTVAIYRALLHQNISPSQLMIMGDSAGGGLALLAVQALINHQLPVPRGVIVLSPFTDLSMSGESYTRNRHTDISPQFDKNWYMAQLLGSNCVQLSLDDPRFSPLFGSFEGFPALYINVGTAEKMEDDSRRMWTKAKEAGVNVKFEEGLHMTHIYPMFFLYYPEAQHTLGNINKWIQTI